MQRQHLIVLSKPFCQLEVLQHTVNDLIDAHFQMNASYVINVPSTLLNFFRRKRPRLIDQCTL